MSFPTFRKRRSSPPRPRQVSGTGGPSEDPPRVGFVIMGSQKEEEEMIELLRRIAELVVLGEQRAAQLSGPNDADRTMDVEEREALALLEFFYERNTLDLIVGIITGDVFRDINVKKDSSSSSLSTLGTSHEYIYLPPISIAIQAVQTVSILLQNVVRATSLYLLLSDNRLGALINLSLELYHSAIKKILDKSSITKDIQSEQIAELSELTTHFISLLKSIALRINAETLQFFITYPYAEKYFNQEGNIPSNIQFPLYSKALSFCSSQYDSFVRITALNICMNLLRASSLEHSSAKPFHFHSSPILTRAVPLNAIQTDENRDSGKVPNAGTLCNFSAISFHDRLGIMKYICSPKRVGELVSSIFLNVATICTMLEENIQGLYVIDGRLDTSNDCIPDKDGSTYEAAFKERSECVRSIRNSAADLEDELLLLNDILKIGLLCLNEQIVELILTTIIYPQLLQPLHSWLQYGIETPTKSISSTTPLVSDHDNIMLSQATTALYVATILFKTITHKPTLHIIFTALCHPLTPHESKSYIVSRSFFTEQFISYEDDSMDSYNFSRDSFVDWPPVEDESSPVEQSEQAVFILSPALFLLFQSATTHSKSESIETKLNPYRSALLASLSQSKEFPLLSKVAAYLLDSMLLSLSSSVMNTLFAYSPNVNDEEGITISDDDIFYGLMNSLYSNLITESIAPTGKFLFNGLSVPLLYAHQPLDIIILNDVGFATLEFDLIVAHAILCASYLNKSIHEASQKLVSLEYSKSISFMSHLPHFIDDKLSSRSDTKPEDINSSNQRYGYILYNLFYGSSDEQFKCVTESLLLNTSHLQSKKDTAFVLIANDNSNGDVSSVFADESRFKAIHEQINVYEDSVDSVLAIIKVGMFVLERSLTFL